METAPLHQDVAHGPPGGAAHWCDAGDGVRIRIAVWPADAGRGTILLFPGRTEYIEKYGRLAGEFAEAGLTTLAIDWRGQGLSDRALPDRLAGHVRDFSEYQLDVEVAVALARKLDLPKPWHLLGHSMGGAIGLRSLIDGLEVATAGFSSPMWGIALSASLKPAAWGMAMAARAARMGHLYAPGRAGPAYPNVQPFEDNMLTHDAAQYAAMAEQTERYPDLALGGPSLGWLAAALTETRHLATLPSPATPCLTVLGTDEMIVDPARIEARMAEWPNGRLMMIPGGRHETLMETPERRSAVVAATLDLFGATVPA